MKVILESTTKIVQLNSVPARIWEGTTSSGIKVHAFITRLAADNEADLTQFNQELEEHAAPSADVQAYQLRLII